MAKEILPNASHNTKPLYDDNGSHRLGYFLSLPQSKLPPSTITPPMLLPWPPKNLVALCTTICAPCSIGRHKYGEAKVLSTMSGMPASLAISAMAAMSMTMPPGLARLSIWMALVFGVSAAFMAAGSVASAQLTFQPNFLKLSPNWLIEPPYNWLAAKNSSPDSNNVCMMTNCAAWPEATANAAVPPSNAATRSSSTAWVGFMIRV